MSRNYIGLACTGHDNALAIVDSEGNLVFAEATERYLQNKRAYNTPPDDPVRIGKLVEEYCEANADLVVACTWSDEAQALLRQETEKTTSPDHRYTIEYVAENIRQAGRHLVGRHNYGSKRFPKRKIEQRAYNHHLCHAAGSCFTSPFDNAMCMVLDAFGEGVSTCYYKYEKGTLSEVEGGRTPMNASLGTFYAWLCTVCGFDPWKGEEWKVMGLAAYGQFNEPLYKAFQRAIGSDGVRLTSDGLVGYGAVLKAAKDVAREDVAHTGQRIFEDVVLELCKNVADLGSYENLILTGGCALNSACNGKIVENTPFEQLFAFCAPADDGNAVGAALLAHQQDNPEHSRRPGFTSPYLGSELSAEAIDNLVRFGGIKKLRKCTDDVCEETAKLLAEGHIVGWVQGRAEFGPRALGNRSILADPRSPHMKDKINSLVKFREEFRPFAPSILHDFGHEYLENYQESPYMERTLKFRSDVRDRVPAVVHANGTGRLQTVKKEWNERYYNLIQCFHEITGVPVVLNTSFNIMGKPIIHSVEDAIGLFFTTGLHALVLGDYVLEKEGA